ncbi:MAG: hypothetical protein ACK4FZ_04015 [Vogesella sp.]|uniref:hypothetical protein n=1 Tax=Vogesella sp. TaxID=1904252 RepID=UPI00391D026D
MFLATALIETNSMDDAQSVNSAAARLSIFKELPQPPARFPHAGPIRQGVPATKKR